MASVSEMMLRTHSYELSLHKIDFSKFIALANVVEHSKLHQSRKISNY